MATLLFNVYSSWWKTNILAFESAVGITFTVQPAFDSTWVMPNFEVDEEGFKGKAPKCKEWHDAIFKKQRDRGA